MAEVTCRGGKTYNDRLLAAEVRTLGLKRIRAILLDENYEKYGKDLHNQVILKLAGTLLPRLNEHTGEDGEPIKVNIINYGADNPSELRSKGIPVGDVAESGKIQDSGLE